MNFAVLVSGNGSNLQAIMDACDRGDVQSTLTVVVSNKEEAYALERAQQAGIPGVFVDPDLYEDRASYDAAVAEVLQEYNVDFVVLAGYMRILSAPFIKQYEDKILNIHPSLLPDFKGAHAIRDAFEAGVSETGATVHYVIEDLDAGPIILQERVKVSETDTLESLEERIHAVEHIIYPQAIVLFEQKHSTL